MPLNSTHILPDPELMEQHRRLEGLMDASALLFQENGLVGLLDSAMKGLFKASLAQIGAHEGTIWILTPDEAFLRPRHNTGPNAAKLLEEVHQDSSQGLISMVLALGCSHHSDRVHEETIHDKTVDRKVGAVTCSMVAVPFNFAGKRRGVLSAVTLKDRPEVPNPPSIPPSAAQLLGNTSVVLGRLFDHRLYSLLSGSAPK